MEMHHNQEILEKFYNYFQSKNYPFMQACYHKNAVFSDPIFNDLNAGEVKAMWKMLLLKGKDLTINFKISEVNDGLGRVEWVATYTFSKTQKKVVNHISSHFIFKDGKIFKQEDYFNFYKWASQAFGITGILMGWTSFFQKKVQDMASKGLSEFIEKDKS